MDYATLTSAKSTTGSLAQWVNYAPVAAEAPELIQNAQDELFGILRVREMRKSLVVPLNAGDSSFPLPAGFLDMLALLDPYGCTIMRVSDDRLLASRTYDISNNLVAGYPIQYGVFDEALQFDVAAVQPYTASGIYYAGTYINGGTPATNATPEVPAVLTSFLTQRYSHLFRAMLLKHAYAYMKDMQEAAAYQSQADAYLAQIQMDDDLSYRGLEMA